MNKNVAKTQEILSSQPTQEKSLKTPKQISQSNLSTLFSLCLSYFLFTYKPNRPKHTQTHKNDKETRTKKKN
jgi:hypothetical protein